MPNAEKYTSPLTEDECKQLERLLARAVEVSDTLSPETLPGWVYAGTSADFDVMLVVVALRSDTPLANTFAQGVLTRVCELAEVLFGARTTVTEVPRAHKS